MNSQTIVNCLNRRDFSSVRKEVLENPSKYITIIEKMLVHEELAEYVVSQLENLLDTIKRMDTNEDDEQHNDVMNTLHTYEEAYEKTQMKLIHENEEYRSVFACDRYPRGFCVEEHMDRKLVEKYWMYVDMGLICV